MQYSEVYGLETSLNAPSKLFDVSESKFTALIILKRSSRCILLFRFMMQRLGSVRYSDFDLV